MKQQFCNFSAWKNQWKLERVDRKFMLTQKTPTGIKRNIFYNKGEVSTFLKKEFNSYLKDEREKGNIYIKQILANVI
jgi:transposase